MREPPRASCPLHALEVEAVMGAARQTCAIGEITDPACPSVGFRATTLEATAGEVESACAGNRRP